MQALSTMCDETLRSGGANTKPTLAATIGMETTGTSITDE